MGTHRAGDTGARESLRGQGDGSDWKAELANYTEADHERFVAEAAAADERAMASPAGQALCDIAAAAWNNDTFPVTGVLHKIWPADETTDDYADARVRWSAEGHEYEILARYHVIHGWAHLSIDVDGNEVADLRGQAAIGDGKVAIALTGGQEFDTGPWEDIVAKLGDQLRQVATS